MLDFEYDLANPGILDQIVDSFNEKIIGESNNKKMIFLASLSKDLPRENRMSVIVSSSSSAGKSNLVNNILEIFDDDVISFTAYTDSHYMRSNPLLNGKIVKIEQMEKTNDKGQADLSMMKHQLSEGSVKTGLSERNEKGQWEATTLTKSGIPVYISTTTNPNINIETMNRTFLIQLDETKSQTERIVNHTLRKYSTPNIENTWKNIIDKNKKLVEFYKDLAKLITKIELPFAPKLTIPTESMEIRRDLDKILNLTCCIAFIHHENRIKIRDNKGENVFQDQFGKTEKHYRYSLIADIEDFREALQIGKNIFSLTLNKVNQDTMQIINIIKENYQSSDGLGMTIDELAKYVSLSQNRTREKLRQGIEAGLIYTKREAHGKIIYFPTDKPFQIIQESMIPKFTHDDIMKWYEREYQGHSDRFEIKLPKS